MRILYPGIFTLFIAALLFCAASALRSRKSMGKPVSLLLCSLVPPVAGNLIIAVAGSGLIATVGFYIYFVGMDLVMFSLLRFTFAYCGISWPDRRFNHIFCFLLLADGVQLLLNPVFGHAFGVHAIQLDRNVFYEVVPYVGQTIHRILDYAVFVTVLLIFLVRSVRAQRVYKERYLVILLVMVVVGLWQSYYIFSDEPVDRSMIGFAVFGLAVFYFSIHYRPVLLLDQMLAQFASEMSEAMFFFDFDGSCIWANDPGAALVGVTGGNYDHVHGLLLEKYGDVVDNEGDWCTVRRMGENDAPRWYILEKQTVSDRRGRRTGSFLRIRDNTEEQLALLREKYLANHDSLTDLYTRECLYERVREAIQSQPAEEFLIVYIDINDFKIINDIFGSAFGDHALRIVANRLREKAPENSIYGRLGGDTFGIYMPESAFDEAELEEELSDFIVRDDAVEHHLLIHLGVYEVTEPELDVSLMFDRAHMALLTVKNEYQKHIAYYDDEMRSRVLWNQIITSQLRDAIRDGQIRPYLQPIADTDGTVVGAEALVRWIHPTYGFLSPALFVPIFEKNGMIAEVDKYMWRCSCEILSRWQEADSPKFISVNISPEDFYFMDVAAELRGIVEEYGVNPAKLRIEITESVMMTDIEQRMKVLYDLKNDGFIVEMDDFGSGYSSLNLLKDMPVDVIKIDMMFLKKSNNDERARTIMNNIIHLSGDLGIYSLTEGVETQDQYRMLSGMGCKLFQGFYFAKPMPVDEFEEKYCAESRKAS